MSDIVERLCCAPFSPEKIQLMREEAATEIERLRAALRAILDDPETGLIGYLYAYRALEGSSDSLQPDDKLPKL